MQIKISKIKIILHMKSLGEKIELLLKEQRRTKKELTELLSLSRPGLDSKLKSSNFKMEELEMIASFLQMDLMELIGRKSEEMSYSTELDSKTETLFNRIYEETRNMKDQLRLLSEQLVIKDKQIDKLLDILGKLDPIAEKAKVVNLNPHYKNIA